MNGGSSGGASKKRDRTLEQPLVENTIAANTARRPGNLALRAHLGQ
jgi:hypothetical protein